MTDPAAGRADAVGGGGARDAGLHVRALFFLIGAAGAFLIPYFVLVLGDRGLTTDLIGFIVGASTLAGILASPLWGHLADTRLGAARTLTISSVACTIFALALFASGSSTPVVLGSCVALGAAQAPTVPLSDTLALGHLGLERMEEYGGIRLWASAGWALVAVIVGALYERVGLEPALPLYAAAALAVAAGASRPALRSPVARELGALPLRSAAETFRETPGFPVLIAGLTLASIATWAGLTFVPVLLVAQGGDLFLVGLAAGVAAVIEIPIFRASPWLVTRLGLRVVYGAGAVVYVVTLLALALSSGPMVTGVARGAVGVAYGLTSAALVVAVGRLVPQRRRTTGQAILQMTTFGVGPVVGAAAGGLVYATLGPSALFGLGAVVTAAGSTVVATTLPGASPSR